MDVPKIHEGEYRFCLIMWEHEPVTAVELVKLCQEQLDWKRTTTYTVIKRLGEKGVLQNDNGTITSLVSKDAAQAYEIDELVEKKFEGSLPAFIAAFTKHQEMSEKELDAAMEHFHAAQLFHLRQHLGNDLIGCDLFLHSIGILQLGVMLNIVKFGEIEEEFFNHHLISVLLHKA